MTGSSKHQPSDEIRRVLARDDLLLLSADADAAVGIVRQRETLARKAEDEPNIFALALTHHLALAENSGAWAIRSQAWDYAATIVRFCDLVDIAVDRRFTRYTAEELHANAMRELEESEPAGVGESLDRDLGLGVFNSYHAARNLRLVGKYDEALRLTMRPLTRFYATGAEPHVAYFNYEVGACYIATDQAAEVDDVLGEWNGYWEKNARAQGFSTRYRSEFIQAIAAWATGDRAEGVRRRLKSALERVPSAAEPAHGGVDQRGVQELSATLALAEFLAGGEPSDADVDEAVSLGRCALDIAEQIRGRWRVIARSRAPLAVAFRRIYGDIALLAARLPGQAAAELGFRVVLSAKQTGFAARIRAGRLLTSPLIGGLLEEIVALEDQPADPLVGNPQTQAAKLARLQFNLTEAVSPMLADTVLPPPTELAPLLDVVGARHALDFVELPDTLSGCNTWFRTLIRPGGAITFERFAPGPAFGAFVKGTADNRKWLGRLADATETPARELEVEREKLTSGDGPDWRQLAEEVLPAALLHDLKVTTDQPMELLISAHSALSLLPWAALTINDEGIRLVERALIAQCPVLTCLSFKQSPPVDGNALIRLVSKAEDGVDVDRERAAWGLNNGADRVPLSRCGIDSGSVPVAEAAGTLTNALETDNDWQFLHIAAHGGGKGLGQFLRFPEGGLTAGQALSLKWPRSVLMASCHVGQLVNPEDAEPLSFVMALLTGGSRCVVAGIDRIDDELTGKAASRMVCDIRKKKLPLDVALRNAQLAAIREGAPEVGWALLSAYTR